MTCREHVAQLRSHYDEITAQGVGLAAIGTGGSRYAKALIEEYDLPFPILLDREAEAAGVASVRHGLSTLAAPGAVVGAARALMTGHRQGRSGPRTTQQGATFVIEPGNVVRYAHLDAYPGDHAPIEQVLDAAGVA